jgi:reactive intermediate/imine deaminase
VGESHTHRHINVPQTNKVSRMKRQIISTDNAPSAIGTYSQAVAVDQTVYLSGQIPLVPDSMELVSTDFAEQANQVFQNLRAVAEAAGGSLSEMAKLTIYLDDLSNFPTVNEVMAQYFAEPFPARAAVQVVALPKAAMIEIDGIMVLDR